MQGKKDKTPRRRDVLREAHVQQKKRRQGPGMNKGETQRRKGVKRRAERCFEKGADIREKRKKKTPRTKKKTF